MTVTLYFIIGLVLALITLACGAGLIKFGMNEDRITYEEFTEIIKVTAVIALFMLLLWYILLIAALTIGIIYLVHYCCESIATWVGKKLWNHYKKGG